MRSCIFQEAGAGWGCAAKFSIILAVVANKFKAFCGKRSIWGSDKAPVLSYPALQDLAPQSLAPRNNASRKRAPRDLAPRGFLGLFLGNQKCGDGGRGYLMTGAWAQDLEVTSCGCLAVQAFTLCPVSSCEGLSYHAAIATNG